MTDERLSEAEKAAADLERHAQSDRYESVAGAIYFGCAQIVRARGRQTEALEAQTRVIDSAWKGIRDAIQGRR